MGTRLHAAGRSLVVLVASLGALAASTLAYGDGIDVSHWQGTINWSKVDADGVQFAFMKATEDNNYYDKTLPTNWAAAKKVGIYRGVYHFARPKKGTAAAQAKYFVSKTGAYLKETGSLPPVLDLEDKGSLGISALRTWTTNWLRTVEDLTGRTPIIYVSPYFWETYLGNSKSYTHYPLWIAHYTTGSPRVPGGWDTWTFWQRTSSGHVNGISGNVDMNKFNGTNAQLAKIANASGGTTDPVPPGPTVPVGAATKLSLGLSATSVAINAPVSFSGDLTASADGAPVAGRGVQLWARSVGGSAWQKVAATTTDVAGHWVVGARVPRSTDYEARSVGNATWAPAISSRVRATTPPRTALSVDLHKNRSVVRKGRPVMIYGHVTAGGSGVAHKGVRYYKKPVRGGHWTRVRTTSSLAPTGWHSITIKPRRTMRWKAVAYSTLRYLPDVSNVITVRVR